MAMPKTVKWFPHISSSKSGRLDPLIPCTSVPFVLSSLRKPRSLLFRTFAWLAVSQIWKQLTSPKQVAHVL